MVTVVKNIQRPVISILALLSATVLRIVTKHQHHYYSYTFFFFIVSSNSYTEMYLFLMA